METCLFELSLPNAKKKEKRRKTNLPPSYFTEGFCFVFLFFFHFSLSSKKRRQPSTGARDGAGFSIGEVRLPSCGHVQAAQVQNKTA